MESKSASSLYDTLLPLRQLGAFHNEAFRQQAISEYGESVNTLMLKVQFAFFSDCFVISMPVNMGGRIYSSVSQIMHKLLKAGFLSRGAITSGLLFHNDQIVFGPGLVSAYAIESRKAKFARVMVDGSALTGC